ncbi:MAG: ABC transporter permease [Candidatus Thorarchaeota archaeon]
MEKRRFLQYAVLSIPFLLLVFFLIIPVGIVLVQGLTVGPGSKFEEVITSVVTHRILSFTLIQAVLSTLLALILGLPGAFLLAKLSFTGKSLLRALLIVPFVLPPIVVVVGFLQMFGSGGILDTMARFILNSQESVLDLASGFTGIILAHAFYNIPLFILIVSAALEKLNPEYEEMAEVLGANTVQKLKRIIIPHIRASVFAASILTFLFCFMSFPIVLALGEGAYLTIEVQIWNAFRFFDYGESSSLALLQILITITLAYSYVRLGTGRHETSGQTGYARTYTLGELSKTARVLIVFYSFILLLLSFGPMISIIRAAIYDPNTRQLTLNGFVNLGTPGINGGLVPLINSLFYASLATVFSVILGTILAYTQREKIRGLANLSSMITLLPLGVSAITIAYGLMIALAVPLGLTINPWILIVIAQTIIGIPFSARALEIAMSKIDQALLEQAESLGANTLQRLFFVELPLLAQGIIVAAVFSFAMAIGEMSATIFLARPENFTLSILIYRDLAVRKFVDAGAASLVLVGFCVAAFILIEKFSQNGYGGTL